MSLTSFQTLNIILILFAPVSFLAKYSIFAQLKRIFTRSRNLIWWLIELSIWFNLILYAIFMFLGIFQCWPRSKIGNPNVQGTCLHFEVLVIPPTMIVLLSDVWMGMLPILTVWKLQIALQRKYAIIAAFCMGMISIAATALELYFSVKLADTHDLTYAAYPIALFAGVQMASLVVAAALPTMPYLWLSLRGIAMQESEPSPLGRMPSRQENRNHRQDWHHDQTKDVERTISIESLVRPETPYEIFTTREVRVTSIHLDQKGLA